MPSRLALLGLLVAGLTTVAVLTGGAGGAWPLHLGLWVAAGLAWAGALASLPWLPARASDGAVVLAVALLVRAAAWAAPPLHSDDVYRYAWDGRVARAGINPYRYPPAAPELAGLRDGAAATPTSRDGERAPPRPTSGAGLFPRINNPDLPTLYPPAAQLLFRAAAALPLPPVGALKLLLGACDLAVLGILWRWLRRRGPAADARWAIAWGWSPLVAIEVGQEVHLDALALVLLTAALSAWELGARARAGAWMGLAIASKTIALPLVVGLRSPRALAAAALAGALVTLPYLDAGAHLVGSSGELARRWRGNEGAFALLQAAAEPAACALVRWHEPPAPPAPDPCARPLRLDDHPRVAELLTGRPRRTTVFPDELSGALARAAVALLLLSLLAALAWRHAPPLATAEWTLGALVLLTPALKPWYLAWLLPLAAVTRRPAWLALAALAPLGYWPMAAWLDGGPWRDPLWTRALLHGAGWTLLLVGAARARAATVPKLDPSAAPATIGPR